MMRRRGFSLVELVLTCAITTILIGTTASIYVFTANRTAHSFATVSTAQQLQDVSRKLDSTINKAISVQIVTVSGNTGLKCTMPETGADTDRDGYLDAFEPKSAIAGIVRWGKGKRVWFYMANSTGSFMSPGPILWRAERSDDLMPTPGDVDRSFTYVNYPTALRYPLFDAATWAMNATDRSVSYTLKSSSLIRADRKSATAYTTEREVSRTATLSRTTNWLNTQ